MGNVKLSFEYTQIDFSGKLLEDVPNDFKVSYANALMTFNKLDVVLEGALQSLTLYQIPSGHVASLTTSNKVDLLNKVVNQFGDKIDVSEEGASFSSLKEYFVVLIQNLKKACELRNKLAHFYFLEMKNDDKDRSRIMGANPKNTLNYKVVKDIELSALELESTAGYFMRLSEELMYLIRIDSEEYLLNDFL